MTITITPQMAKAGWSRYEDSENKNLDGCIVKPHGYIDKLFIAEDSKTEFFDLLYQKEDEPVVLAHQFPTLALSLEGASRGVILV